MHDIVPLGDRGFLAQFADSPSAARWAYALRAARWDEVIDIVPAYDRVAILVDPSNRDVASMLGSFRAFVPRESAEPSTGKRITIPVLYDGEDLSDVASRLGLTPDEVIELH